MEQILPALERQLRSFRRQASWLGSLHPALASQLGAANVGPDAHVDRLVQGVALLHARSALALQRARCRQDEHLLELYFPEQLRAFPECRIGPGRGACGGAKIVSARYCPGREAVIELGLVPGPSTAATLDIYIDGDPAFSAALRGALLTGDGGRLPLVQPAGSKEWHPVARWPLTPTGMTPEEALLPRAPGAHAGLALLREFFTFPARFNVLWLDLSMFAAAGRCILRLPAPDSPLLPVLQASHLRAGWSAAACLQRVAATPVILDGRQCEYLVSVSPELEIFSIDTVRVGGAANGDWVVRRIDDAPPGHEWRIAFQSAGALRYGSVASVDVSCCRRDAVLARPARGPACRWQLNSLLALDALPVNAGALRERMATQAVGMPAAAQAIIGAVQAIDARPVLLASGRAAPLMGTELRLRVDESALSGCGLLLFAQIMERYFGECTQMNAFTRLVLYSARTGKELIRCQARNASSVLE